MLISVAVITFNSVKLIGPCLDSIMQQGHKDYEIIVVDNGSEDGTDLFIQERYCGAVLIRNQRNIGAAGARNQAIRAANGEFILTLDCDAVLRNDFISEISKLLEKLPAKIGIIQPKILQADRKRIYSAGIFLSLLRRFYDIGRGEMDSGRFNRTLPVFGACSAAAIYRRKMLEEIKDRGGYFDERFFFLAEDVDLSWRANRKGWKAIFYPGAVCYHSGNSYRCERKVRQYLSFRNRYYSIIKNENFSGIYRNIIPLFFYDFARFVYMFLTNPYTAKALTETLDFIKDKKNA